MGDRHDLPYDDLHPSDPPIELRQRTLTAARTALERGDRPDVWARLWGSRTFRLAWAASVGCLLYGHVVMNHDAGDGPTSPALPLAVVAGADPELTEVATLPRLTAQLPGFDVTRPTLRSTPETSEENEETS